MEQSNLENAHSYQSGADSFVAGVILRQIENVSTILQSKNLFVKKSTRKQLKKQT